MIERTVNIPTPDGQMPTFITHPRDGGPFAPIVVYMDVWGEREELHDIARRIATTGYYVMLPNLYYRFGGGSTEYRDAQGKMISLEILDDERKSRTRAPMLQLSDAMVVSDTGAMLKFMDAGEPVKKGGPVGSVGYCMGGRHVVRVAGAFPERFKGSASLHGTRLVTDAADSPHLDAIKAQGELYFGFAEHDPFAPLSHIPIIEQAMRGSKAKFSHEMHKGARHGYALPDRDIHDKHAANLDWELMFAMWRRQLAP